MNIPEIFKNRNKIWEGLRNKLFKKEHVEQIYNERLKVCQGCKLYDTDGVGCAVPGTQPCCNSQLSEDVDGIEIKGCGCSLSLKLRSLSSECPLHKWAAITSQQEENMINQQLDDKGQG